MTNEQTLLAPLLAQLDTFAEDGQLRRLGTAFARFMASLGMTTPSQIVSCTVLSELEGRGHSCLMLDALASAPCALLGWSTEQWQILADAAAPLPLDVAGWRNTLGECAQVWVVGDKDLQQPLVLDKDRLYLRRYWRDETQVAQAVGDRAAKKREVDVVLARQWLDKLFDAAPQDDAGPDWQKIACAIAVRSTLSIITGGPGTGKTYTVARLLALLFALADAPDRLRIALAAPTGKAAARLKQSIDNALTDLAAKVGDALPLAELTLRMGSARTLHSLLGARPDTRAFRHHAGNPLDVDVLIVDEASMVHLEMMASLLDALPPSAMLILLGDKDQLASVEAGAVLGDLCRDAQSGGYSADTVTYAMAAAGEAIPSEFLGNAGPLGQQTVMLRKSRRFSGPIGSLALAVNAGETAQAVECLRTGENNILAWLEHADQSDMLQLALDGRQGAQVGYRKYLNLLKQRPDTQDSALYELWVSSVLQTFESYRILCAVRDGEWGVAGLNQTIEQRLEAEGLIKRRSEWYVGRPVMVTRNDYGTGVFNGDIGITLPDPLRTDSLRVYFLEGQAVRSVLATRLRNVETAYAMTVHKSQGSEFRHTVMVLPQESGPVVTRELVYTGITRAREHFTLVSPVPAVFEEAIKRRTQRASGLGSLLN
jgi:exodeoxyribonuclease V alpha subunit